MKKRELIIYIIGLIISVVGVFFTIKVISNSVILGIITTLIGSFITFLLGRICEIVKDGFSQFTGYYRDEIFSNENSTEIIKRDKFQLIEKGGNTLLGDFTRYFPENTQYANWKCSGFIVLDQFLLAYRAVKDTTPSKGIIIVKLDTTRINGLLPCYTGKYYRFEGEDIVEYKINLIKINKEEYDNL